jgi:ribonuclease HI
MTKQKYYVVWKGRRRGIFDSWAGCTSAVSGYPGAEYRAFDTLVAAQAAFHGRYTDYMGKPTSTQKWLFSPSKPLLPSICVDAACDGSPGRLEYRGVDLETGGQIFHAGPYSDGTNNVGEFLAIVGAIEWLRKKKSRLPIYSDSRNALAWVKAGKCRTTLVHTPRNAVLFDLILWAENMLRDLHQKGYEPEILKWDTAAWGENPADFGRK